MRRIVFDLDSTLETPYISAKQFPQAWKILVDRFGVEGASRMVFHWPYRGKHFYFIAYPGALELLQWVHSQNIAIDFFSGALIERNVDLAEMMMRRVFGDEPVPYRVFHGALHSPTDDNPDYEAKYVGYYYGIQKKKLEDVVVTHEELPDTLLVDDDRSFAAKGEEGNLVCAYFVGSEYKHYFYKKIRNVHANDDYDGLELHHVFYLAGVLEQIVTLANAERKSLRDAAIQVQFLNEGIEFPFVNAEVNHVPRPHFEDAHYYLRGLRLLRKINPSLDFWYGIETGWWDEFGRNQRRLCEDEIEQSVEETRRRERAQRG